MGETEQDSPGMQSFQFPVPTPRDSWHIVVVGAMDPRQHNPFWYKVIGAITDNEAKKTQGFATPIQVQFSILEFTVQCSTSRWEISTHSENNLSRIEQVTEKVFQKLSEVPVQAFGINTAIHADTKAKEVRMILSKILLEDDLGFPDSDERDCSIHYIAGNSKDLTTSITIGQSTMAPNKVGVDYNRQHVIRGTGGYFDLGPEIRKHTRADWGAAGDFAAKLAARINFLAGD